MARLTPFGQRIDVFTERHLTDKARREAVAKAAIEARDNAIQINTAALNGRAPQYDTIVDGRIGATELDVKKGGTIAYLFKLGAATMNEAIDRAALTYAELAPVKTGEYLRGLRLFVNGVEAAPVGASVVNVLPTDLVQLTNLLPYARKIEAGWSDQAPNGVFELVAMRLRRVFGNVLRIEYGYERYVGFSAGRKRVASSAGDKLRSQPLAASERFPTITLRLK